MSPPPSPAVVVPGAAIAPTPGLEPATTIASIPSSYTETRSECQLLKQCPHLFPASGTHLWRTHGPGLGPHGRSPGPPRSHLGTHGIGYQMTCRPGQPGSAAHPQTGDQGSVSFLQREQCLHKATRHAHIPSNVQSQGTSQMENPLPGPPVFIDPVLVGGVGWSEGG